MSENTATDTTGPTNKRTRFDKSVASLPADGHGKASKQQPPKALAESFVRSHVVSLQTQLATILQRLGIQHVNTLATAYNKAKQIKHMESVEDFIPRSARLNFMFHVSKKAEESPEFVTLKDETDEILQQCRLALKTKIIAATKIELSIIQERLRTEFVTNMRLVIQAFLIGESNNTDVDDFVYTFMDTYHEDLLKHVDMNLAAFRTLYKSHHNLTAFPTSHSNVTTHAAAATQVRLAAAATASRHEDSLGFDLMQTEVLTDNTVDTVIFTPTPPSTGTQTGNTEQDKIKRVIEAVFVTSWDQFISQCKRNEIALELKKLSTEHFTTKSTEDAAMEIDEEAPADRRQLEDLVRKQAQAETKDLRKEVQRLRTLISKTIDGRKPNTKGKNNQRGPPGGASQQKQNAKTSRGRGTPSAQSSSDQQNKQRKPAQRNRRAQPAGESDNDSSSDRSSNSSRKKKKTNERNKQSSTTRRSKQSTQSNRR